MYTNNTTPPLRLQGTHARKIENVIFPNPILGINKINYAWEVLIYLRHWELIPSTNKGSRINKLELSRYRKLVRHRFKSAGITLARHISLERILLSIHEFGETSIPGESLARFFYSLYSQQVEQ